MRVLISGGGVAGMTLAYWLRHHGFTPVVVERARHRRRGGYGIDFFGPGHEVATRMGIIDRLTPHQLPVESMEFVDRAGRTVARLNGALLDRVIDGPHLGLMHSTLEAALTDAVHDRVETRYGRVISAVAEDDDAVEVRFDDGTRDRFDLLLGADGVHSGTRDLVFGPEPRFARYLGYHIACYSVPDRYDLGPVRAHYSEPGRQVIVYPTGQPGELIALFLFRSDSGRSVPRAQRLDRLRDAFGGTGWITPRLLADAPESGAIFMDTLTQIAMPTWHRGRVALVGDAAGCMTPTSAQGVSFAMTGAHVLAEALARETDHTSAFHHYTNQLHASVARRQRSARRLARSLVPSTRVGLAGRNLLSRLVLREAFSPLIRRQFGAGGALLPPEEPPANARRH